MRYAVISTINQQHYEKPRKIIVGPIKTDFVIDTIIKEANANSQLKTLGHELMDVIALDWLNSVFPGVPARGSSDYASFQAADTTGFSLSSLSWSYWDYTWHTNRDTYNKIIFSDVRNNVILTAILAYKTSEDPETTSREKLYCLSIQEPVSHGNGQVHKGGLD